MNRRILSIGLLVLICSGCVSSNVTRLSNKTYAPVHPDDVVIYLGEADIHGDYEKVAVIYSKGDHLWTDERAMLQNARKKAGKLGANGVLVVRMKEPGTGAKVAQAIIGTEADRRAELIAIYVLPETGSSAKEPVRGLW